MQSLTLNILSLGQFYFSIGCQNIVCAASSSGSYHLNRPWVRFQELGFVKKPGLHQMISINLMEV